MTAPAMAVSPVRVQSTRSDSAIGEDAKSLRALFEGVQRPSASVVLGRTLWDLDLVWWESTRPNWDGDGARAVDRATYLMAKQFLHALPMSSFPTLPPDISADPDGELSFTWRKAPKQVFSVSVGGNGRLSYAGIFGAVNTHGTEYFIGQIPQTILAGMFRLVLGA